MAGDAVNSSGSWLTASFSNFGTAIEVAAPGVEILSLLNYTEDYWPGSGTSMAAPHVAGAAALLLQAKPNATVAQVEQAIQSTCTLLPDQTPLRFGFGLINPAEALRALA